MSKLCVSKLCMSKLCVYKLCVSKLCVDNLCVSKLCEQVVCEQIVYEQVVCVQVVCTSSCVATCMLTRCVWTSCVWTSRRERRRGGEAEVQNQKQEPHTKMWGIILNPVAPSGSDPISSTLGQAIYCHEVHEIPRRKLVEPTSH